MIISINKKRLAISLIIPIAVGLLSSFITAGDMDIYKDIDKPPFAPNGIVFPIVWSVLYILMGISLYLVWNKPDRYADKKRALFFFGLSLFFNFIWSPIFFSLRSYMAAFVVLILLFITVIVTIVEFYKLDRIAALLQIPYIIWLLFAGYLNLAIYYMNK